MTPEVWKPREIKGSSLLDCKPIWRNTVRIKTLQTVSQFSHSGNNWLLDCNQMPQNCKDLIFFAFPMVK